MSIPVEGAQRSLNRHDMVGLIGDHLSAKSPDREHLWNIGTVVAPEPCVLTILLVTRHIIPQVIHWLLFGFMFAETDPVTPALRTPSTHLLLFPTCIHLRNLHSPPIESRASGISSHEDRVCCLYTLLCHAHIGKPASNTRGSQAGPMRSADRHPGKSWLSVTIRPDQHAALFYRLPRYVAVSA